jgi:hypothetical protein
MNLVVVLLKVRCRFRAPLRGGVRLSGDELIFQASDGEVRLAFNMVTGQVRRGPPDEPCSLVPARLRRVKSTNRSSLTPARHPDALHNVRCGRARPWRLRRAGRRCRASPSSWPAAGRRSGGATPACWAPMAPARRRASRRLMSSMVSAAHAECEIFCRV